ncbi:hypothetical protein BC936DRAFT_137956 [Jimgerdemannia flammicorona]|uniref:RING-type domain-containing protein n=1 Tax=Jimgerdemannia flammicorona TaxID=994334 RepID=A0A433DIQ2_9FUNG|nr:hypothetical protein BC936DRAFT_137956 [Jimgerdemannia flammicorona]
MTASFAGLILTGVILYDNQTDLSITSRVLSSNAWNISIYPDNDIDSSIAALGNAQNFYWVPTVFIGNSLGLALHNLAFNGSVYWRPGSRDFVRIRMFNSSAAANTGGFWMSFLKNWVPGIVMAGITMLLATLIFRLHRRYIRRLIRRRRIQARNLCMLPKDVLDTFIVRLYDVEATKNQSCAICLDDFIEGESTVRVLPCGHGFCVECIDPWLSTKTAQCPICKFDCSPPKPSAAGEEGVVLEPTSTTTSGADEGVAIIELAALTSKPGTGVIWEQVGRLDVEARERERRSMLEERKGEASEQGKEEERVVAKETIQ